MVVKNKTCTMFAAFVVGQVLMSVFLRGSSALLTSSFGFLQDDVSLTLAKKVRCVREYMDGYYVGVSYDTIFHTCSGLLREWRANVTLEPNTIYMVKTKSHDYLDPPISIYQIESVESNSYFTMLPGIPYAPSKITIKWTPLDPWTKLSIRIKDPKTGDSFLRMLIKNTLQETIFAHENSQTMADKETVVDFPFVAGQLSTIDFDIQSTQTQIYVDGLLYHAYTHRKPFETAKAVTIWPPTNGSFYVHSVMMNFPMPIIP